MRQAVIWDFHGTLADISSVLHFVEAKDYDSFYEQSLSCPPIESTVLAARQSHEAGYVNLLFTGMPDQYAESLSQWLAEHGVPIDLISMRTAQDRFKKDFVVKKRMYLDAVDLGYYVLRAWEDRETVADLWRRLGIPVVMVPPWGESQTSREVDKTSTAP